MVIISEFQKHARESRSIGTSMSKNHPNKTILNKDEKATVTDTKSNDFTNCTFSQAHHFMEPHLNVAQAPNIVSKLDLQ